MPDKKDAVEILVRLINKTSTEAKKIVDSLKGVKKSTDDATKSGKKFQDGLDETAKKTKKVNDNFKTLKGGVPVFKQISTALKNTNVSLTSVSIGLGALSSALAAPFVLGVSKAAEFQQGMATVKAVSGATTEEFEKLNEVAKELGRTTRFTAVEASEGLRFLSMAGLDATTSMEALPSVLQLAQAGTLELGEAADITTNILTGYGKEATELAHVNDVLVTAFTNSNSTLRELGTAFTYVGPIAKGVGANFEELVGTLGNLHNAGIKGSLAGTTLRATIDALFNPTKQEAELMKQLGDRIGGAGLVIKNSQGNFVGFTKIIEQLEASGITAEEALRLFGQRAGPGMVALLQQGSTALGKFGDQLKDVDGAAEKIAKTMDETFEGSVKRLASAFDGLLIAIGDNLLPILTEIVDAITWVVTKFTEFHEALGPLSVVIDVLLATLGSLGVALAAIAAGWALIGAPIAGLITAMGGLSAVMGILSGVFTAAAGAVTAFFVAIGPVGWIILGITAAVVGLYTAYKILNESLEEQIENAEKQAKAYQKVQDDIDKYQQTVIKLEKGSKELKKTNFELRESLFKLAKENAVLSEFALAAAKSIDAQTGAITDNGQAIETLKKAGFVAELGEIAKKSKALSLQLKEVSGASDFAEVKKQVDDINDTLFRTPSALADQMEEVEELKKAYTDIQIEADRFTTELIEAGKIKPFETTEENLRDIVKSYGLVGEGSKLMRDAVVNSFNDIERNATEKANRVVESLLKVSEVEIETSKFEKGFDELVGIVIDKHGDLKDNAEVFGEETLEQYKDIYNTLPETALDGFLALFRTHKKQTEKILLSSKTAAEKEKALAVSKNRFLVGLEQMAAKDIANARIKGYKGLINELENLNNLELAQLDITTQKKIAAARGDEAKILKIERDAANEKAKIQADLLVQRQRATEQLLEDTKAVYATESEEVKKASEAVKQADQAVSDFKIQEINRRQTALNSQIDASIAKEEEYANRVKQLDEEIKASREKIANFERQIAFVQFDTEDKIRDVRRRNMTEAQKQADLRRQADEKLAKARRFFYDDDFESAQRLAQQSQGIFASLEDSGRAISGIGASGKVLEDILQKQKQLAEEEEAALQKQKQAAQEALEAQKVATENLRASMEGVISSVDKLVAELQALRTEAATPLNFDADTAPAESKFTNLFEKIKSGTEEVVDRGKSILDGLRESTDTGIEIKGDFSLFDAAVQQAKEKVTSEPVEQKVTIDSVEALQQLDILKQPVETQYTVKPETSGVDAFINKLKQPITTTVTVVRNIIERITGNEGVVVGRGYNKGGITNYSAGAKLPGFGYKDTVHAFLTLGERVLNATSTKILDNAYPGMMDRINASRSETQIKQILAGSIQGLNLGGIAGFQNGGIPTIPVNGNGGGNINLSMPINISANGNGAGDISKLFREEIIPQFKDAVKRNSQGIATELRKVKS